MIEVTEAVKLAKQYANELFEGEDIKHLGLEEVLFDDVDGEWHVTLGFDSYRVKTIKQVPSPLSSSVSSILVPSNVKEETLREYKTFRLNGEDGGFKGMLMREVG